MEDYFERKTWEEKKRGTKRARQSLLTGGPGLFVAATVCRTTRVNFAREFRGDSRGVAEAACTATDTPSVATLLSINRRTHANGHFTFPPMGTWKIRRDLSLLPIENRAPRERYASNVSDVFLLDFPFEHSCFCEILEFFHDTLERP